MLAVAWRFVSHSAPLRLLCQSPFWRLQASACLQERVQRFQTDNSIPIFLLTSQVGGLGLTLTAADRVIILDPAWNPSVDNQSVDRACRIGQTRDVVVYRLITCGTIEEKIYRKQVYKGALSRTGTDEADPFRYFSHQARASTLMSAYLVYCLCGMVKAIPRL